MVERPGAADRERSRSALIFRNRTQTRESVLPSKVPEGEIMPRSLTLTALALAAATATLPAQNRTLGFGRAD